MRKQLAISIDGPTASGKTSLAYALAAQLDMRVLDTGLTYRAVAYVASRGPVPPGRQLFDALRHEPATPGTRPVTPTVVYHQESIIDDLWSSEVEQHLRAVSADPAWRHVITQYHRTIVDGHERMIAVGRDCATTIMTDADCHIFLTAADAVRRERRRAQHRAQPGRAVHVGPPTRLDDTIREYVACRPHGLVLDTTFLPAVAVLRAVVHHLGAPR
ncbi:(d)CMP kinase [Solwaraspora sp. WMMD792]|uniref:(d)CMP kinase n=1 Tax=Solwaraspora sp. WMMD792 TaxID=3016099 RepID=UPI0024172B6F|nr:(d)CMP kinase [Solwaraspora sp. WMMD792]MDG4771541.1 (d)CMP kinase [Solwaraspora sp. WMMD792]